MLHYSQFCMIKDVLGTIWALFLKVGQATTARIFLSSIFPNPLVTSRGSFGLWRISYLCLVQTTEHDFHTSVGSRYVNKANV